MNWDCRRYVKDQQYWNIQKGLIIIHLLIIHRSFSVEKAIQNECKSGVLFRFFFRSFYYGIFAFLFSHVGVVYASLITQIKYVFVVFWRRMLKVNVSDCVITLSCTIANVIIYLTELFIFFIVSHFNYYDESLLNIYKLWSIIEEKWHDCKFIYSKDMSNSTPKSTDTIYSDH